jgi:hypothetical protein
MIRDPAKSAAQARGFKKSVVVTPGAAAVLARIPDLGERRALTRLAAEVADLLHVMGALDGHSRELPRHSLELKERLVEAWPVGVDALLAGGRVLAAVREAYPEVPGNTDDSDLDAAFGGDGAGAPASDPHAGIHALGWGLRHELDRVRATFEGKPPQDHEAAWRALVELQELRGRLRNAVGELLFEAFHAHAEVTREEVIPGYGEELANALALRRAIAVRR